MNLIIFLPLEAFTFFAITCANRRQQDHHLLIPHETSNPSISIFNWGCQAPLENSYVMPQNIVLLATYAVSNHANIWMLSTTQGIKVKVTIITIILNISTR